MWVEARKVAISAQNREAKRLKFENALPPGRIVRLDICDELKEGLRLAVTDIQREDYV